jgi:hypothetical protein
MNLKLQGTAGTGIVLGEYYLSWFLHFLATRLGPIADGWTCVCNSFSTNLKLQGTTNTGSVWVVIFLIFYLTLKALE